MPVVEVFTCIAASILPVSVEVVKKANSTTEVFMFPLLSALNAFELQFHSGKLKSVSSSTKD